MLVEEELAAISPEKDMFLTIGVFDGVHLGHRYLISKLKEAAKQNNCLSGVITFRWHPLEVLAPGTAPPYLTSSEEKVALLRAEKVDHAIPLSFTAELANLTAREFIGLLQKYLRMRGLVVGPDFTLGKDREGTISVLRELGEETGFSVTVVEFKNLSGEVVSSTAIRQHLAQGEILNVSRMLGRTFSLQGPVIKGDGRGKILGFPTANIEVDSVQSLLPEGVYATRVVIDGISYRSVTNIGKRPTFGDNERNVEIYVIDFQGDLYGKELKLDIVDLLRGEKKFDSPDDLKRQITEDITRAKSLLGKTPDR